MPAKTKNTQSRRVLHNKKKESKNLKPGKNVFRLVLILALVLSFLLYFATRTKYWDGKHKLVLAISDSNGDVQLDVFDPVSSQITKIQIPGSTEVDVAHQLGIWRLKVVPKLGEKEGEGPDILPLTITKHFKFPVYAWGEEPVK